MIHKLTEQVYFGDRFAPFECPVPVGTIINVAHHIRGHYFKQLKSIPYTTWYVRVAKKDREDIDDANWQMLMSTVLVAHRHGKLPILAHCQMGGHRGPTTGLFAAWVLAGWANLEQLHARTLELVPRLVSGKNYYHSMMAWMRAFTASIDKVGKVAG